MKEKLESRLQVLIAERQQYIAQLTATLSTNNGAIEEVKLWIAEIEREALSLVTSEIPAVAPAEAPVDAPTPFLQPSNEAAEATSSEVVTAPEVTAAPIPDENPDATAVTPAV